ncbi:hypothetical protein AC578_4137 [Pseudocercospora eumusae]|uniref:Uncharacterized protein n=1 Tax=Pseudocercospora eumusae TaxID=321146 RepID=A0A139HFB2_9PEZI|nr:hypothetical protein AC578_4137 [Pseudocercospora eumusae]
MSNRVSQNAASECCLPVRVQLRPPSLKQAEEDHNDVGSPVDGGQSQCLASTEGETSYQD